MALVTMDFESQYLVGNTTVSVILPARPRDLDAADFYSSGKKYPVVWVLHGTHGDSTDWMRMSMLEVYARERNIICVMPSGLNADYTNWPGFATGFDMESYLVKELMPAIHGWFPASDRPEDNYIAGLSMGGQGALRYITKFPDKFAAAAILSFAPGNPRALENDSLAKGLRWENVINNAGGKEKYIASDDNTWDKVIKMNKEGTLPKLYCCVGEEDFLYDRVMAFKKMCQENNIGITFEEEAGYGHEWRFWNKYIEKAFDFFGLEKAPNANDWRGLKDAVKFFVKERS